MVKREGCEWGERERERGVSRVKKRGERGECEWGERGV